MFVENANISNEPKIGFRAKPECLSKDIVRLCLTLDGRSPRGYIELRGSNFLILPSQNLLRKYKNSLHQEAGVNKDMAELMANEAKIKNIPPAGFQGGLIIDEMSIQPDVQFKKLNNSIQLIGFTDCTPESIVFGQMKNNKREKTIATHVLLLVFLGASQVSFFHLLISLLTLHRDMNYTTCMEICKYANNIRVHILIYQ